MRSGCEVAVHASVDLFAEEENHGLLQIDASNAFNSINRAVTPHNVNILCPEFATYIQNCYQSPARLFVSGGIEIRSNEGTTQGDPVAMCIYAIGILPLVNLHDLDENSKNVPKRVAYADDFTGVGKLEELRSWWENIVHHGPNIGYYPKADKS